MKDNKKCLIQSFYDSLHKEGQRLNQSFIESIKGQYIAFRFVNRNP